MLEDIRQAAEILKSGGIILYPTDTIWGIGCDATNPQAVSRIFQLKKREDSKAMLILMDHESGLTRYISEIPEIAWQLLDVADKPMTIIFPGAKNLALNLIAEDGSVGIRIAKDEFCQKLIGRFGKPIVSTSANVSGENTPRNYSEISNTIIKDVDYVVKWRQNETTPATPSSIIKLGPGGEFKIIRP